MCLSTTRWNVDRAISLKQFEPKGEMALEKLVYLSLLHWDNMACDAVLREVLRLRLPRLLLPKRTQLLHLQAQLQTAKGTLAYWDLSCKALASQVQQVNSSTCVSGLQQFTSFCICLPP